MSIKPRGSFNVRDVICVKAVKSYSLSRSSDQGVYTYLKFKVRSSVGIIEKTLEGDELENPKNYQIGANHGDDLFHICDFSIIRLLNIGKSFQIFVPEYT